MRRSVEIRSGLGGSASAWPHDANQPPMAFPPGGVFSGFFIDSLFLLSL
jgi:hypothetical protein